MFETSPFWGSSFCWVGGYTAVVCFLRAVFQGQSFSASLGFREWTDMGRCTAWFLGPWVDNKIPNESQILGPNFGLGFWGLEIQRSSKWTFRNFHTLMTGSARAMMGLKISIFVAECSYRASKCATSGWMCVSLKRLCEEPIFASPCKNDHMLSLIYPVFAKVSIDVLG